MILLVPEHGCSSNKRVATETLVSVMRLPFGEPGCDSLLMNLVVTPFLVNLAVTPLLVNLVVAPLVKVVVTPLQNLIGALVKLVVRGEELFGSLLNLAVWRSLVKLVGLVNLLVGWLGSLVKLVGLVELPA